MNLDFVHKAVGGVQLYCMHSGFQLAFLLRIVVGIPMLRTYEGTMYGMHTL